MPPTPPRDQQGDRVAELVSVMNRLLAPDGCPWDQEQTLETLKPFLIEEAYEVLEAIDQGPTDHCEELGDLLLQIVFQAALRAREGAFGIDDVAQAIVDKLVRRHPHVFGDAKVSGSAQVLEQWNEIKAKEKPKRKRALDGVPSGLPALLRAQRLQEKASAVGFDWPDASGPRQKISEELSELEEALAESAPSPEAARARAQAELGDLLFAVVNFARKHALDAESALAQATTRFAKRFTHVEDRLLERGSSPAQSSLAEMDALWDEAKRRGTGPA